MKYLRTFIALPLEVNDQFLKARTELMRKLEKERISWVDPERYHVTIRFLGDTAPGLLEELRYSFRNRFKTPSKTINYLGRVSSFGPRKMPRVIWVGFEDPHPFDLIRKDVDGVLAGLGLKTEDQVFRPHLTLGRIRSLKDLQEYRLVIESMKDRFSGAILTHRLVYYQSELGSGGPVYTPLEEIKFQDQPF